MTVICCCERAHARAGFFSSILIFLRVIGCGGGGGGGGQNEDPPPASARRGRSDPVVVWFSPLSGADGEQVMPPPAQTLGPQVSLRLSNRNLNVSSW